MKSNWLSNASCYLYFLGSPRAFVKYYYDPDRLPYPEPFVKGVENSFGNPIVRKKFYKKYYQLLMHGQFPHKETKLCLVGPADSGKTSWFSPLQGIIPSRYIAGVMNDGKFSAAMITNNTQVVMMDEWTPDSLSCEDAKRVLQGKIAIMILILCATIFLVVRGSVREFIVFVSV